MTQQMNTDSFRLSSRSLATGIRQGRPVKLCLSLHAEVVRRGLLQDGEAVYEDNGISFRPFDTLEQHKQWVKQNLLFMSCKC